MAKLPSFGPTASTTPGVGDSEVRPGFPHQRLDVVAFIARIECTHETPPSSVWMWAASCPAPVPISALPPVLECLAGGKPTALRQMRRLPRCDRSPSPAGGFCDTTARGSTRARPASRDPGFRTPGGRLVAAHPERSSASNPSSVMNTLATFPVIVARPTRAAAVPLGRLRPSARGVHRAWNEPPTAPQCDRDTNAGIGDARPHFLNGTRATARPPQTDQRRPRPGRLSVGSRAGPLCALASDPPESRSEHFGRNRVSGSSGHRE